MQPENDAADRGPGGQLRLGDSGRERREADADELPGLGGMAPE